MAQGFRFQLMYKLISKKESYNEGLHFLTFSVCDKKR